MKRPKRLWPFAVSTKSREQIVGMYSKNCLGKFGISWGMEGKQLSISNHPIPFPASLSICPCFSVNVLLHYQHRNRQCKESWNIRQWKHTEMDTLLLLAFLTACFLLLQQLWLKIIGEMTSSWPSIRTMYINLNRYEKSLNSYPVYHTTFGYIFYTLEERTYTSMVGWHQALDNFSQWILSACLCQSYEVMAVVIQGMITVFIKSLQCTSDTFITGVAGWWVLDCVEVFIGLKPFLFDTITAVHDHMNLFFFHCHHQSTHVACSIWLPTHLVEYVVSRLQICYLTDRNRIEWNSWWNFTDPISMVDSTSVDHWFYHTMTKAYELDTKAH